jgi:hypothetical protein
MIKTVNKVAEHTINIQNPVVFPYINKELVEKEIRKKIPFTIASKPPTNMNKSIQEGKRPLK